MSWYEEAFGKDYLDLYLHRDEESARGEAAFAAEAMDLLEGARVLDVGCGAGRHSRALKRQGYAPVGVDLSRELLARARDLRVVRADMRRLPFRAAFPAAVSFFTSFGYFDDVGNRETARAIASCLERGGRFLLDFLNAPVVRRTLSPEDEVSRAGAVYRIRRWIEEGRVFKEVAVSREEGSRGYTESVRLYDREEIEALLASCGLQVKKRFGAFDGSPHTNSSPRLVLLAIRV